MTHLCVADWDGLANDVAYSRGLCTHRGLMLPCLFTLFLDLCVDPLLLLDEIICVLLRLTGV